MSLSDILRKALIARGIHAAEIERAIDVPRDSINRFLSGEQSLQLQSAEKLARFLGIGFVAPEWLINETADPTNCLQRIAKAINLARPSLKCPMTTGHFFTVTEIEPSVKLEVLRRARGRGTVVAVGLAFNSGSKALNRKQADRYRAILEIPNPPFDVEWFPSPKTNCYLTAVRSVPPASEAMDKFLNSCVGAALWFADFRYGRQKK